MIFQARTDNTNIREVMCKFNLVTYGGLILMYPLLIYTNLRAFFFIGISLIMIPQIYSNAINGHRPNFGSAYYMKFLSFRFLLIVNIIRYLDLFEVFPLEYLRIITKLFVRFQLYSIVDFPSILMNNLVIFALDAENLWPQKGSPSIFVASCI